MDGLDVDQLMIFFRILFQLSDFPGMSDSTLLELVYPYCRGSVAERVARTIRDGGSVARFHGGVLDACVPGLLRKQLQHKHCYRVQAHGENFAKFVQSIRDAVRILGLGLPENEVVQMIFEGVTPQERCV